MKALLPVMLLLVGNVAVKAQTEKSDFTFEDGRCYSKWVINSRIGQFWANTTEMGFAKFKENGDQEGNLNKGGKTRLDYVPGLVAKGIIEAAQYYSQYPWAKPWFLSIANYGKEWYQTLPGGGTPDTTKEFEGGGSLDDLNGFKLYITLYELAKDGGVFADDNVSSQAETAINNAIKGLKDHNKNYVIKEGTLAGNDVVGGWFHKKAYNNQMWLDGQYMGPALLAQIINYNNKTNNVSTDDWKTIIKQLDIVWSQCWNETDGLLYHAFEANGGTGKSNSHANLWKGLSSTNFHSESYWGRACGWYFLALVDILAEMDKANLSSNPTYSADYTRIKGYLTSLAKGLAAKRDANTGGWYQILDKDGTYSASEYDNGRSNTQTYNYIESSATAIFAAAYLKAIRLEYLSEADYGETATNAYKCIVNNFFAKDVEGVHIFGSCRSAGLGSDKTDGTAEKGNANFRDGSNAYYLLGSDVTRVAKSKNETEGKVLGAFILAATEYERLHTTLVHDLPATSTVGTALKLGLSGTENANETRSYKWYKNGDTTPVAETAEYTPTEAGTYKCVVDVNSGAYTITSKEVTVSAATEEPTTPSDNVGTEGTISWTEMATTGHNANKLGVVSTNLPKGAITPVKGVVSTSLSTNGTSQITKDGQKADYYKYKGVPGPEDKETYFQYSYTVSDGYTFIPSKVSVSWAPAGGKDMNVNVYGSSDGTTYTQIGTTLNNGTDKVYKTADLVISSGSNYKYIRIVPYNKADQSVVLDGVVITGKLSSGSTDPSTTYTIKYDLNGVTASNAPADVTVNEAKIKLPETNPTATDYNFIGWYTDEACTIVAEAGASVTPVEGIITLYAKWEPKSSDVNTTFGSGTLDGTTLTVTALESTAAGKQQTINVTLPKGANATVPNGADYSFDNGVLTYTAPAAGSSKEMTLIVTAEDGKTKATYTINVSTKAASTGGETESYFWFFNPADAETNGVTQSDFFKGVPTSGGTNITESAQIGEKTYTVSKRSSNSGHAVTFTIDSEKTGKFYAFVNPNSKSRKFTLTNTTTSVSKDVTVSVNELQTITFGELASGDYKLTGDGNYGLILLCMELVNVGPSNETATTFEAAGSSLSADGKTLTITHEYTEAGQTGKTIAVTPAAKAKYTLTPEKDGAELSSDYKTITYTVPAANTTKTYKLNVIAEDGETSAEYTINITTKPAPGSMAEYTATFTLDQMKAFGSKAGKGVTVFYNEINSDDNALTLTAVAGTTSGTNIEATGSDDGGAKMQTTASFKLTPVKGVKIKKVFVTTTTTGRSLTATSTTTSSSKGEQSASDNKIWEYTFNSIEEAITFKNENADNINVLRINVVYEKAAGDGKTALSAKFSKDVLEWYVNDAMPELPTLTVTAIGVENYKDYTVKYSSSNTNVVTVDATTGALKVVDGIEGGSASITAVVTPTDPNTYVSTSTLYTVNIKPLNEPVVTVQDMTIYNTVGVQPQPVVTVYVKDEKGNDIVLDPRYYTLSYTPQNGSDPILMNSTQGDFILAGSAGNWTTGSAVVRVTCTPEDEAKTLYHIKEADATFNVNVVAAGDKLIPTLGGVEDAKMNAKTKREFVKAVLYNGVDITSGFTYKYEITNEDGVSGSKYALVKDKDGKEIKGHVTLTAGTLTNPGTNGTVIITITATPDENNAEQYEKAIGTIKVTVGDYKDFTSVTLSPSEIPAKVGDVLQNFVVKVLDENKNEVPEDDYTMVWGSSAPGIVGVVGDRTQGIFNAVSEGQAIVRVYIKKDGYADMKGECIVTVSDPGKYVVKEGLDVSIGKELPVDGLTLTLGGWMFKGDPDLSSYNATTETFGNASVKWGSPAKDNNKPVGFTHNISMGYQKNARQEFGSNCQPESYGIYNGTIKEQTTKVLDPMFNVPCYGAYFALAPKTTGRVTVYVRQNGVFDDDTATGRDHKGVYRPQRRVFVMDEMGGFVSSTPELVYPTAWKPETATLKDFDCDLFDLKAADKKDITQFTKTPEIQTTEDWIKSHFIGLQSFTMSKTDFKNGVYASNLPTEVTHNQAQINRTDKDGNVTDISARGWSVLSVAPVSYTFDVKPGKTYYIYNFGSKLGLYGFVFRKGSPIIDELPEWSEKSTPAIAKTEENHVAKVSIDREFVPGIWNACVLPFSMNRQQISAVFGNCYDINNPAGTQILYFDRVENGKIYFVRHAYNTIVAGKPFLIKPSKKKEDGPIKITSENMGDFPYVTIESTGEEGLDFGKDNKTAAYYWTSSYGKFDINPGDYFIRDTEINQKSPDGKVVRYPSNKKPDLLPMNGFRGYLAARNEDLRQSAKALTIAISDFESDETTYIENVEIAEDGTLRQRLSGKVYNLQGQLVSNDASQLDSLPKGIYIVNGTKVSVK